MNKWMACAAAFCVSAALLLAGCGSRPTVHVMKAEPSREPFTLETKAAPEALHTAPVIPQVSGNLISNPPDVGTIVNAGDELFKIDSSQYESQAASLRSQIAAASQAAAPSPSYSYSAPAVDDSLEASLLKQGIITRAEYERIKGRKGGAPRQHRLQHPHRQRHQPSWWPPSRHWRKPLRTALSVPPSAASFPRYTSATPIWLWQENRLSLSARILRSLLPCRFHPSWIT